MSVDIRQGDARALDLPDESVDLIVTSPPYFGLRDYGTADQLGAEPTPAEYVAALVKCTAEMVRVLKPSGSIFVNLGDKYGPNKSLRLLPERYRIACTDELALIARAVLVWSKPNGLPSSVADRVNRTHEDWVHLTKRPRYYSAIDEIRSPADPAGRAGRTPTRGAALGPELRATLHADDGATVARGWCLARPLQDAVRTAVAANAEGLQVLQPVGFHMRVETPERNYVVDLDAVGRPALDAEMAVAVHDALSKLSPSGASPGLVSTRPAGVLLADVVFDDTPRRAEVVDLHCVPIATEGLAARVTVNLDQGQATLLVWDSSAAHHSILPQKSNPLGKLPGSVWEIATQPLRVPAELGVDHFAAQPMEWPRRLILGWSPREVCTACGEGRRPVTSKVANLDAWHDREAVAKFRAQSTVTLDELRQVGASGMQQLRDLRSAPGAVSRHHGMGANWPLAVKVDEVFGGWANRVIGAATGSAAIMGYACACPVTTAASTPGVVLDPFGGTGTTALVADVLGRHGISVDLSEDYCRLARWRVSDPKQRERASRPAGAKPVRARRSANEPELPLSRVPVVVPAEMSVSALVGDVPALPCVRVHGAGDELAIAVDGGGVSGANGLLGHETTVSRRLHATVEDMAS